MTLFRSHSRMLVLACATLGSAAGPMGCGGGTASQHAATSATGESRAPIANAAHGPVKWVGEALGDVPLTDPQRSEIEKLAADAEARQEGVRAAHRELGLAVASQVQAGSIDRAALQPKLDALVTALQRVEPADRQAFERLHAILTPDQRTAFVNALEAHVRDRFRAGREKHPLRQWAKDLNLSDDQREHLKAIFEAGFDGPRKGPHGGPPEHGERRGAKMMDAFKQDRFVMDEVEPSPDVSAHVRTKSDHVLGLIEKALPILTPEQRTVASQKLRDRAEEGEQGGPLGMP